MMLLNKLVFLPDWAVFVTLVFYLFLVNLLLFSIFKLKKIKDRKNFLEIIIKSINIAIVVPIMLLTFNHLMMQAVIHPNNQKNIGHLITTVCEIVFMTLGQIIFGILEFIQKPFLDKEIINGQIVYVDYNKYYVDEIGYVLTFALALLPIFIMVHLIIRVSSILLKRKFKKTTTSDKHKKTELKFFQLLVTSLVSSIAVISFLFIYANTDRKQRLGVLYDFNHFNAHLKHICVEQTNKDGCPRDVSQLKAFKPEEYQNLEKRTQIQYYYHSKTDSYSWTVRFNKDRVYVSAPEFYPGYGYLTLEEARQRGYWRE